MSFCIGCEFNGVEEKDNDDSPFVIVSVLVVDGLASVKSPQSSSLLCGARSMRIRSG